MWWVNLLMGMYARLYSLRLGIGLIGFAVAVVDGISFVVGLDVRINASRAKGDPLSPNKLAVN